MSFYMFETADAAHGAFACRVSKYQAEDDLMLNGTTTAKVDAGLPSFADWDILVITSKPRDALIVRGGTLISVHSMSPTTREALAASGSALYKLRELDVTDRKQKIEEAVAAAVGPRASLSEGKLLIDGEPVWDLSISEDRSRTYVGRGTGTLSVTVGDYGDKSRYPQRKDGSHNYPEIAAKLVRYHDMRMAKVQASKKRDSNSQHVKQLTDQFGYHPWNFTATTEESAPVLVKRPLAFHGTPNEVRRFITEIDKVLAQFKR